MMILVISAQGAKLDSPVDPRFGRARNFIAYDTDKGSFTAHDNALNLNAVQGAGIQSATTVIDLGGTAVVTGNVGPKAFSALQTAGIDIYIGASGTVQDAIDAFTNGTLTKSGGASVQGHW